MASLLYSSQAMMRWPLLCLILILSVVSVIWQEFKDIDRDQALVTSDDCNDLEKVYKFKEINERCNEAKERLTRSVEERLQGRLHDFATHVVQYFMEHQFLKPWYVRTVLPFLIIAYWGYCNNFKKERLRQDHQYKIFHETQMLAMRREEQQAELMQQMFQLYRRNMIPVQRHIERPRYATPMIEDKDNADD